LGKSLTMLFVLLSVACSGAVLETSFELPNRIVKAGFDKDTKHPTVCTAWCRVDPNVRLLTNAEGDALAYEVKFLPRESNALDTAVNTWGAPTADYTVDMDPAMDLQAHPAWQEASRALHRRYLGAAAEVLRVGDHRDTTRYGLWKSGSELVRVSSSPRAIWVEWVNLHQLQAR